MSKLPQKPNIRFLLDEILSEDEKRSQTARVMLLALDEDAIEPLVDEFYAGVNEAQGVVILDVAAEIGGPDALQLLEDVFRHGQNPVWQRWALLGLARNHREDVLDVIFEWLQTGNLPERQAATLALGYVGQEEAEIALVHALHEADIAPQAVRALEKRQSVEGLAAGYNTDDAEVWALVTNALLDLGDPGILPLIEIMQSEHPDFHEKVLISLQNLNRPEAKEVLRAGDYNPDGSSKDVD